MAIYRQIHMSFWTDAKVVDDFTPEDKYFYVYLLTNPHTNLAGCYELSMKQASDETGYNREAIEKIIKRMENEHHVVAYDKATKEVLIVNWSKYNWINSEKFRKPLEKEILSVKSKPFREYLQTKFERGEDTVSIPYPYGMDTTVTVTDTVTVSDTDTVSVTDTVTDTVSDIKPVTNNTQRRQSADDSMIAERGFSPHLDSAVREWVKYKKEKRQGYKEVGLSNLLTKIQREAQAHGEDKVADLIHECMANNWQGIIWDRLSEQHKGTVSPNDSRYSTSSRMRPLEEWKERKRKESSYVDGRVL